MENNISSDNNKKNQNFHKNGFDFEPDININDKKNSDSLYNYISNAQILY